MVEYIKNLPIAVQITILVYTALSIASVGLAIMDLEDDPNKIGNVKDVLLLIRSLFIVALIGPPILVFFPLEYWRIL